MKSRQGYAWMGAIVVVLTIALLADQNVRDANAQQSTLENQSDQTDPQLDQAGQTDPLQTRGQVGQRRDASARARDPNQRGWRASELIGMNVRGKTGDDEIGEIADVMIGAEGEIRYAAVSFGGFLGLGEKLFAVPWEAVQFVREGEDEDDIYARIEVTEQQLENRPGFNDDNWPTKGDETFRRGEARTPRQVERPGAGTPDTNVPR